MLRKREWQKKSVHGDGIGKKNLAHINDPRKKFPASSKSPTHPRPFMPDLIV